MLSFIICQELGLMAVSSLIGAAFCTQPDVGQPRFEVSRTKHTGLRNSRQSRNVQTQALCDSSENVEERDEYFMRAALAEANKAACIGEVPVGAVIVHAGGIIARAHNRVEIDGDPTAHAEILCIRNAAKRLRRWRLMETTLYVTLEPCPMCAGTVLQARVGQLVWGAPNNLLGADGSWVNLFPVNVDAENGCSRRQLVHPFHPHIQVRRRVLSSECAEVMQSFFRARRNGRTRPDEQTESLPFLLGSLMKFFKQFTQ